jgi:hypothetical protein
VSRTGWAQALRTVAPDNSVSACAASPSADRVAVSVPALLVLVVALMPVLANALPATDDFINHLARCYVILRHGTDPLLDRSYGIEWKVVPNLAIDLIVPPLARLAGIFLAGKLFVLSYMLLLLSGPHAIHYALYQRLSIGPLAATLFLYNWIDRFGTVNYEFSVGLAMWLVALCIALRRAPPQLRGAIWRFAWWFSSSATLRTWRSTGSLSQALRRNGFGRNVPLLACWAVISPRCCLSCLR